MNLQALRAADVGSLVAIAVALVVGLATLPALPGEVTIHWAADGSSNTVVPALPGLLLLPAIAGLAFGYLRGGALLPGRSAVRGSTPGLGVVAGVAYLQVALVALNLGVLENPLLAVVPGIVAILAATYADRTRGVSGP